MVYKEYVQQRIILLSQCGLRTPTIARVLVREGIPVDRTGVHNFLQRLRETGTTARRVGSGRPFKYHGCHKSCCDEQRTKWWDNTEEISKFYQFTICNCFFNCYMYIQYMLMFFSLSFALFYVLQRVVYILSSREKNLREQRKSRADFQFWSRKRATPA